MLVDVKKPLRGVMIYDRARIDANNVLPMVVRLFEQSTPADKIQAVSEDYLEMVDCVVIRITPERMVSFDNEKYDVFRRLSEKHDLKWDWW